MIHKEQAEVFLASLPSEFSIADVERVAFAFPGECQFVWYIIGWFLHNEWIAIAEYGKTLDERRWCKTGRFCDSFDDLSRLRTELVDFKNPKYEKSVQEMEVYWRLFSKTNNPDDFLCGAGYIIQLMICWRNGKWTNDVYVFVEKEAQIYYLPRVYEASFATNDMVAVNWYARFPVNKDTMRLVNYRLVDQGNPELLNYKIPDRKIVRVNFEPNEFVRI